MGSTFLVFNLVTVCFCLIMKVFGLLFILGSAYCGVPSCTTVWENKCWDEPRQQVCNKVPKQECKDVPKQDYKDVPRQKCNSVPKEECNTEYKEKCTTQYKQVTKYDDKQEC